MDTLKEEIQSLDLSERVFLLGHREDIAELCGGADLFVFPSFMEGLPVALMEAIATKTPVLCSRIRGNTDLVHGDMFDPHSVDDIRESLRKLFAAGNLFEAKAADIEANYENVQKYDVRNATELTCALYPKENA